MHAMVGMGIFICKKVRRKTRFIWPPFMRNMTMDIRAATKTDVPGEVSQAKLNKADSGFRSPLL